MLQVARLAPKQLGESRDLVAAFLRDRLNADGGFQDRTGASDLYYTVFALDALIALQAQLPVDRTAAYIAQFGDGAGLDFVHLACLARSYACIGRRPSDPAADRLLNRLESFRTPDGGYSTVAAAPEGTAYAAFLAMCAYEDLSSEQPNRQAIADSISRLRAADGGYANQSSMAVGVTTATAAAVLVLRHLDVPVDRGVGMWLLDRCHARGGFFAAPAAPVPDLLSTATALHALTAMHVPLAAVQEPCLDFVDSLWTNRGGFYGSWADDVLDCEYTYYGLLALGHLSLQ